MTEVNPCGFLQNAGSVHTAEVLREPFNMLFAGRGSASFSQRGRGGVHPGLGLALAVSQNSTPNMSVQIGSGHAFVPGTEGASQGCYSCFNDGTINKSLTASDPSLPRIDLVVAKVQDSFYSGATNSWSLAIVTGTPNSSPVAPTAPANSITLAQVAVAAGTTAIVTANITDVRPWLAAQGGLIPVRSQTERDALLGTYDGFAVWRQDLDMVQVYNGSSFLDFPGEVALRQLRYAKTSDQSRASTTTLTADSQLVTATLPANSIWKVTANIYYSATGDSTVGGINIGWTGPSGATFDWVPMTKTGADGTGFAGALWVLQCNIGSTIGCGGGPGPLTACPTGELAISSTPGTFSFRWAQATSNAAATTVKAGSRLYLQRVG